LRSIAVSPCHAESIDPPARGLCRIAAIGPVLPPNGCATSVNLHCDDPAPRRRRQRPKARTGTAGRPAHGRHWRAILLWLRDADGDGVRDRSETAIAPYPLAAGEVGPERRALGVRSVAACARRARNLALVDAPAERDLFGCCSGRRRQRARRLRSGIRMNALR